MTNDRNVKQNEQDRQLRWRRLLCKINCIIMDCKILMDLRIVYTRFKYSLACGTRSLTLAHLSQLTFMSFICHSYSANHKSEVNCTHFAELVTGNLVCFYGAFIRLSRNDRAVLINAVSCLSS